MLTSSYSQGIYPKKVLINKDTLILITPFQVRKLNKVFILKNSLRDKNEVLMETLAAYEVLSDEKDNIIQAKIKLENGYLKSLEGLNNENLRINDKNIVLLRQRKILFVVSISLVAIVLIK